MPKTTNRKSTTELLDDPALRDAMGIVEKRLKEIEQRVAKRTVYRSQSAPSVVTHIAGPVVVQDGQLVVTAKCFGNPMIICAAPHIDGSGDSKFTLQSTTDIAEGKIEVYREDKSLGGYSPYLEIPAASDVILGLPPMGLFVMDLYAPAGVNKYQVRFTYGANTVMGYENLQLLAWEL